MNSSKPAAKIEITTEGKRREEPKEKISVEYIDPPPD